MHVEIPLVGFVTWRLAAIRLRERIAGGDVSERAPSQRGLIIAKSL